MTSRATSIAVGATVVTKKDFDALRPDDQKVVLDEAQILQKKILETVRRDNERALSKMKAMGIEVVEAPQALVDELKHGGLAVWDELAGKMYSKEWLDRIKQILNEYRKSHS